MNDAGKEAILDELLGLIGPPPIRPDDIKTADLVAATGLSRRAMLDRMHKLAAESDEWETLIVMAGNRRVRVLRKVGD